MTTLSQTWMLRILLLVSGLFWSGCVTHQDVVVSSRYPTDYVIGSIYRLKQGLAAERDNSSIFRQHDTFMPLPSPTLSEVQTHPELYARNYVTVPANTLVQIERFDLEKNDENGIFMWVRGRVLNGALTNQELMLSFISRKAGASVLQTDLLMVDTNYLERVESR